MALCWRTGDIGSRCLKCLARSVWLYLQPALHQCSYSLGYTFQGTSSGSRVSCEMFHWGLPVLLLSCIWAQVLSLDLTSAILHWNLCQAHSLGQQSLNPGWPWLLTPNSLPLLHGKYGTVVLFPAHLSSSPASSTPSPQGWKGRQEQLGVLL